MKTTFGCIEEKAWAGTKKKRVIVAAAHDLHTLKGIESAYSKGGLDFTLIGNGSDIERIIKDQSLNIHGAEIIDEADDKSAARKSVCMVASGVGDILMKGKLNTADLLIEVVDKSFDLVTGEILSHVGLFDIPDYHKLLLMTDGGMVIAPDIAQKRMIIKNALRVAHALDIEIPKVACLSATETENQKIPGSVDAALLKRENTEGIIQDCIIEGPISFDLMYDRETAIIKGYESSVPGDADICLFPDMTAGNLVAKSLMCAGKAMMAGLIVGARVPIVLVSRGATAEEKYWSIVFAAAIA